MANPGEVIRQLTEEREEARNKARQLFQLVCIVDPMRVPPEWRGWFLKFQLDGAKESPWLLEASAAREAGRRE